MTEPAAFQSQFLQTLQARGYLHQITHPAELDAAASAGVVTGYIGFDATAPSLHVGSLVQIMLLRRLQQSGHRPIVVMGGGTTRVGDPTGRDTSRPLLTDDLIAANIASIRTVFERFLDFGEGPTGAIMVDNDAWLSRFGYVEFLRTFGTRFTVNRMLAFDSVRLRLEREEPMTFTEFNYMLMQSVDFLELFRRYGCTLQMGGSDQWGNITAGADLVRRVDQAAAFGVTTPLLTTASGGKMGKTAQGAVWLNEEQLKPEHYWQYWRNVEDADVGRFLRLFTDLPLDEIAALESRTGSSINEAKKILADEATGMLHGRAAASEARAIAEGLFEGGVTVSSNTYSEFEFCGTPSEIGRNNGVPFTRRTAAAILAVAQSTSQNAARKTINSGGVRINGEIITDPDRYYSIDDVNPESGMFEIQVGKRGAVKRLKPRQEPF